jgi:hypothetical protein
MLSLGDRAMNMPRFSAEASVYKTSDRYHALMAVSHHQTDGAVRPASCIGECVHECLQEGHMRAAACVRMCRWECSHLEF